MRIFTTNNKYLYMLLGFLFWILLWELLYRSINQEILVVSPFAVLVRIFELSGSGDFWLTVFKTFVRILSGFTIAIIVGIFLAVFIHTIPISSYLIKPLLDIIKASPVVSFIMLCLVWLHTDTVPTFITFLMTLPVIFSNVWQGILEVDKRLLEMAQVFHFSSLRKIRYIYIPSVLPYFKSAAVSGLSIAWKSGISAEVIGTPKISIGKKLHESKIYLETLDLFAWTVVIILLSVLLEKSFVYFMRKLRSDSHGA